MIAGDDLRILEELAAALREVEGQLDAADRMRGHSPWAAIAHLALRITGPAEELSPPFREIYPDLVARLAAGQSLHTCWGGLTDEIEVLLRRAEEVGVVLVASQDVE